MILEQEWQFRARLLRNPKEPFAEAEHIPKPINLQVQARALGVLLFAGGAHTPNTSSCAPSCSREMQEKRMEMSIYLQTGKEDHIGTRMSTILDFPQRGRPERPEIHESERLRRDLSKTRLVDFI